MPPTDTQKKYQIELQAQKMLFDIPKHVSNREKHDFGLYYSNDGYWRSIGSWKISKKLQSVGTYLGMVFWIFLPNLITEPRFMKVLCFNWKRIPDKKSRTPLSRPNFLHFHAVSWKFGRVIGWRPVYEILNPPLKQFFTIVTSYSGIIFLCWSYPDASRLQAAKTDFCDKQTSF